MSEERSEKPTAKRIKDAHAKGQFARSQDLTLALSLIFSLILLFLFGNLLFSSLKELMKDLFSSMNTLYAKDEIHLIKSRIYFPLVLVGSLSFFIFFFSFIFNGIQTLFHFSVSHFGDSRKKRKDFIYNFFYTLVKWGMSGWVGVWLMRWIMEGSITFEERAKRVMSSLFLMALFFLLLALADYLIQRYKFYKSLFMTKQEVKDEMREENLSKRTKERE